MNELSGSSSEDDDLYVNSVACLKALKKKPSIEPEKRNEPEEITTDETIKIPSPEEPQEINCTPLSSIDKVPSTSARSHKQCTGLNLRSRRCRGITQNSEKGSEILSLQAENNVGQSESDSVICIDVDDEEVPSSIIIPDDDDPLEDENYHVVVKILWRSKTVVRLKVRKYETFHKVFEYFAKLESVSEEQILISKNDRRVVPTDSPASIDLSIIDILEGGIMSREVLAMRNECQSNNDDTQDKNLCKLKVQTANKQSLVINLRRDHRFKAVFINCADQLGVEESRIKLYFDGEQISVTDTPESLDLEQDACIDLKISGS